MSSELGRIIFVVFLVTQFFKILMAAPIVMDGMLLIGGFIAMLYITYELIHAYKEAQ